MLGGWILGAPLKSAVVEYPGTPPGTFTGSVTGGVIRLGNQAIATAWSFDRAGLKALSIRDVQDRTGLTLTGEVFQIVLTNGQRYRASSLTPEGTPVVRAILPQPNAARLAARSAGSSVEWALRSADGRLRVEWRAVAGNGANYVRQEIAITARAAALGIQEIVWLDGAVPGARVAGRVDGSPVVAGSFFGERRSDGGQPGRPAVAGAGRVVARSGCNAGAELRRRGGAGRPDAASVSRVCRA